MKKLILLSTLVALFSASPIFGQSERYDATEQSKRLARKNNHITKTYKGEVVKMLYRGLNSYGGVLTGFVFRKENGKLLWYCFHASCSAKGNVTKEASITELLSLLSRKKNSLEKKEFSIKKEGNEMIITLTLS